MSISTQDRLAIHELVALHGHLVDSGDFDRMTELYTDDIRYDVSAYGFGVLVGIRAGIDAALALGDRNPLAHHVTNVVVVGERGDGGVLVRSKGFGVNQDGTIGSVVYEDVVRRTPAGWRIAERAVIPRRRPLQR